MRTHRRRQLRNEKEDYIGENMDSKCCDRSDGEKRAIASVALNSLLSYCLFLCGRRAPLDFFDRIQITAPAADCRAVLDDGSCCRHIMRGLI